MKKYLITFIFFLALISIVSAQTPYRNLPPPVLGTVTTSSGGGNVTSVSSGDNCIFVNPTTGDVIITFNTSCGSGASGVNSVVAGSNFLIIDPTTGDVIVNINSSRLNETIAQYGVAVGFNSTFNSTYAQFAYNQTTAVFTMSLLNDTIASYGNAIGFNSTFNATYAQFAYNQTTAVFQMALLNNTIAQYGVLVGFNSTFNATYDQFAYNQTTAVFTMTLLNQTISNLGVLIGFNSTFNSTYNNLLNQMCPAGQVVNGTLSNGTIRCRPVVTSLSTTTPDCLSLSATVGDITIDIPDVCLGVGEVNVFPPYLSQNSNFQIVNITFNETQLNRTISDLGVRVGFNDTRNPFNQTLNTTSNVTFANITARNVDIQNLSWKYGRADGQQFIDTEIGAPWYTFTVLDGVVQAAYLTNIALNFAFVGGATLPMYFLSFSGNSSLVVENDAIGQIAVESVNGFDVRNTSGFVFFEANRTGVGIYRNLSFTGTRINGPCVIGSEGCIANLTGFNITSNHQTYNISSSTSLDTTYTNTQGRVIYLDVTFESSVVASGDQAYITLYRNGTYYSAEGIIFAAKSDTGEGNTELHHLGAYIQPSQVWSLNSTVGGSGSVSLARVYLTVI